MAERPGPDEWSTSRLPLDRRGRLELAPAYESLAAQIVASGIVLEARIEHYRDRPKNASKSIHQVIYRIDVPPELFDPFYNGADGLRGRYWQGPAIGDAATRWLIDRFESRLLEITPDRYVINGRTQIPEISAVRASLHGRSAKVWPFEWEARPDGQRHTLIKPDQPEHLVVERWARNETLPEAKGRSWRWTPASGSIEIKGALISPEHLEFVPDAKKDRAEQIYKFGFT